MKKLSKAIKALSCLLLSLSLFSFFNPNQFPTSNEQVSIWLTTTDQSQELSPQTAVNFAPDAGSNPVTITVDDNTTYQQMDGFGYTFTEGSAELINSMGATQQNALLNDIYNPSTGIGSSIIRISIGASDLSSSVYSYDQTSGDVNMNNFSLSGPDLTYLIPLLKKVLLINPNVKILATPWSPPTWMKTNNNSVGGDLNTNDYAAYALYFVKYLQAMQAQGITIWAITPQNEPENTTDNPSMGLSSAEETNFINNNLGPAIRNAGFSTKIIAYDHNCDDTNYPTYVLNNSSYTDGASFHLYAGDISAMSTVHNATGKNVYFTEQFTAIGGNFGGDLGWHMQNVVIGSSVNWSKAILEWNVASDPNGNPHTSGGCTTCQGAVTINNSTTYTRNVAYYIISHVSKFVTPGAYRISSNFSGSIQNAAFKNPDGSIVVVAINTGTSSSTFKIKWGSQSFTYTLAAGAVASFKWNSTTIAAPSAPTNLTATAGNAQVTLNWTASTGAASYTVARSTVSGGPYTTVATGMTSTTYTDASATNGTTYYYVVSAVNSGGSSSNSTQASATPTAPTISAFTTIQAESYTSMSGIQTESCSDTGGGLDVGNTDSNDYLAFSNVNFGTNAVSVDVRMASAATFTGTGEFHLGSPTGTLIGTVSFGNTGGWQTWVTKNVPVTGVTGVQNLYMVFQGGTSIGNVNWIKFDSATVTVPAPSAPTNLTATAGNAQVALSWTASANATSYNVARATVSGGAYTIIATGITSTTYTDVSVTNGTTYYYVVSAVNTGGSSGNSSQASATPTAPTISAFTTIQAESYTSMSGIQTESCSDTGGGLDVGNTDSNDYLAFNNINFGTNAVSVDVRMASAATFTGTAQFRLGSVTGTLIGTVSFGNTGGWQTWVTKNVPVTGVTGVQNLYMVFQGGTSIGNVNWIKFDSATVTAPAPSAPTNLTATAGNAQVVLNWTASANATSYTVARATVSGGAYTTIATSITATTYTDASVTNGTTYYYVVSAVNTGGSSANSSQASATPTAPTISSFTTIQAESYTSMSGIQTESCSDTGGGLDVGNTDSNDYLAFSNVNFGTNAVSVDVRMASAATFTGTAEFHLGSPTGTLIGTVSFGNTGGWQTWVTKNVAVTGVTGVQNLYMVFQGGTSIGNVNWIKFDSATVAVPAPSAPTNLTATAGNAQVVLNWTASANATSYTVARATVSGGAYTTIATSITATTYTDVSVTNGTTYYYVVSAVNTGGSSSNSSQASATPAVPPTSAFTTIQAESYNSMSGIQTESCSDTGGGLDVGYTDPNDYIAFTNIDFGTGAVSVDVRLASAATFTGTGEFHLGSPTGTLIGTVSFGNTGGWQTWVTKNVTVTGATGVQNLYMVFQGGAGIGNINWFKFYAASQRPAYEIATTTFDATIYPNPNKGNFMLQLNDFPSEPVTVIINDMAGQEISRNVFTTKNIDFTKEKNLQRGIYFIQVIKGSDKIVKRLVIN